MIVDAHAHLFMYGNIDEIVKENKKRGVKYVIENGLNYDSNLKVLEENEKYPDFILASLGLHPTEVRNLTDNDIELVLSQIEENKERIVAIGEVGLDFYWIKEEEWRKRQIEVFRRILELSEKIRKPIIIHSRNAEKEVIEILGNYNSKFILHSYGGKISLARRAIENKIYFSIPAIVYKSSQYQRLVEEVPIELMLTETDSPFLDPINFRKNKPWKILYGLQRISEIKGIEIKELEERIYENFSKLFLR